MWTVNSTGTKFELQHFTDKKKKELYKGAGLRRGVPLLTKENARTRSLSTVTKWWLQLETCAVKTLPPPFFFDFDCFLIFGYYHSINSIDNTPFACTHPYRKRTGILNQSFIGPFFLWGLKSNLRIHMHYGMTRQALIGPSSGWCLRHGGSRRYWGGCQRAE